MGPPSPSPPPPLPRLMGAVAVAVVRPHQASVRPVRGGRYVLGLFPRFARVAPVVKEAVDPVSLAAAVVDGPLI